jgi:hypothetical protein
MRKKRETGLNAKQFNEAFCTGVALQEDTFRKLLSHLRAGNSIDCFGPMSEKTIWEATKKYPETWKLEEIEIALRDAKEGWEKIGRQQALGTCIGNSRSWFYNMSNRYGWSDKQKVETSGNSQLQVSIVNYSSTKQAKDTIEAG